jgi:thiol-disulfide isomerase/thioredoxin
MKYILVVAALILSHFVNAQSIPSYKAEALMQRINGEDTLYIINFWATWCGPCVKELPEFDKLYEKYKDQPVKILMVSLDFKEDLSYKVPNFLKRKNFLPEVVWLNETNANQFIPKIEQRWQGSIPATLILYKKKEYRNFFEGTIKASQISVLVDKQLAF